MISRTGTVFVKISWIGIMFRFGPVWALNTQNNEYSFANEEYSIIMIQQILNQHAFKLGNHYHIIGMSCNCFITILPEQMKTIPILSFFNKKLRNLEIL